MAAIAPAIGRAFAAGGGGAAGGGLAGGGFGQLAGALGGLGQQADVVGGQIGQAGQAMSQTGQATDQLTRNLGQLHPHFGKLAAHLSQMANDAARYVQAFAPAEVDLFHQAIKDLNASIGEQLVPVVRLARDVFRAIGDTIAGFTPVVRPLVQAFTEMVGPVFVAVTQVFREVGTALLPLAPVVRQVFGAVQEIFGNMSGAVGEAAKHFGTLFGTIVQLVSPIAELVIEMSPLRWILNETFAGFAKLFMVLNRGLQQVREWLGLPDLERPKFDDASRGKGFAQASTTTAGALFSRLQERAFQLGREGGGAADNPAVKQVNLLQKIETAIKDLPDQIAAAIRNRVNNAADNAADRFVGGVGRVLGQGAVDLLARIPRWDGVG